MIRDDDDRGGEEVRRVVRMEVSKEKQEPHT